MVMVLVPLVLLKKIFIKNSVIRLHNSFCLDFFKVSLEFCQCICMSQPCYNNFNYKCMLQLNCLSVENNFTMKLGDTIRH